VTHLRANCDPVLKGSILFERGPLFIGGLKWGGGGERAGQEATGFRINASISEGKGGSAVKAQRLSVLE